MEDWELRWERFRGRIGLIVGRKTLGIFVAAMVLLASITAIWALDRHERGVTISAYTDKEDYESGEPVRIYIQLKNHGFSSVTLVYPSSLIMSFSIYNSDDVEVFTGPSIGLTVITDVYLEPGGVKRHEYTWYQTVNTGEWVDRPDTFTIRAFSWSFEEHFHAQVTFSVWASL